MYPVLLDLKQCAVLVVGGGKIATRKINALVSSGGCPTVIAPSILPELVPLVQNQQIRLKQRKFHCGDTKGYQLIYICTNQESVNQAICAEVTAHQFVNDTTKQTRSNFFNMAYFKEGDCGIAVTTFGKSPKKSREIKEEIQEFLRNFVSTKEKKPTP